MRKGLVVASARGGGLSSASIRLEAKGPGRLTVEVAPATYLGARAAGVQNMVVTRSATASLSPVQPPAQLDVAVACVNMPLEAPAGDHDLVIQPLPSRADRPAKWADLRKLLSSAAFTELGRVQQQFAVWTITDDPSSAEAYKQISVTEVPRPGAAASLPPRPHGPDLDRVRTTLQQAGIDPSRYLVFRPPSSAPPEPPWEARSQERVAEARKAMFEALAAAHRRAAAAGRGPNGSPDPAAEARQLQAATEALEAAERRALTAAADRKGAAAKAYAEAKEQGRTEDEAWEAAERHAGPYAQAEARARKEADEVYRQWSSLRKKP